MKNAKKTAAGFILIILVLFLTACPVIDPPQPAAPEDSWIYFGGRENGLAKIWKVNGNDYSERTEMVLTHDTAILNTVMDIQLVDGVMHSLVYRGSSPRSLCYFKGDQLIKETVDDMIDAKSIYISGDMVYIFGSYLKSFFLWTINHTTGEDHFYEVDTSNYTDAEALLVVGNDIYLGGSKYTTSGSTEGTYIWKGSLDNLGAGFTAKRIPDAAKRANIKNFCLQGETLYACGREYSATSGKWIAAYWEINRSDLSVKNTVYPEVDAALYNSEVTKIVAAGNDIHLIGKQGTVNGTAYDRLKYWHNGTVSNLNAGTDFCSLFDLYTDGQSVIAAGYENILDTSVLFNRYNDVARFWVDGVSYDLTAPKVSSAIMCIEGE